MQQRDKRITPIEAKAKIYRYCAYQERCHQEVKTKLFEFGLSRSDVEEIVTDLITEGYLNEERYARSYAGGKFRMKKWGRIKIQHELEQRGLTPACIRAGLKEIEQDAYDLTLTNLIMAKAKQTNAANLFVKRDKVASYVIQKGFEPELVWKVVKENIAE